jgi:hypothetical protein
MRATRGPFGQAEAWRRFSRSHYTGRTIGSGAVRGPVPGQLAHVFLISILDAALLSWLALLWYRRSVRRLMGGRGSPGAARCRRLAPTLRVRGNRAGTRACIRAFSTRPGRPSGCRSHRRASPSRAAIAWGASLWSRDDGPCWWKGSGAAALVVWFGDAWINAGRSRRPSSSSPCQRRASVWWAAGTPASARSRSSCSRSSARSCGAP